jgi:hypothetical protein
VTSEEEELIVGLELGGAWATVEPRSELSKEYTSNAPNSGLNGEKQS